MADEALADERLRARSARAFERALRVRTSTTRKEPILAGVAAEIEDAPGSSLREAHRARGRKTDRAGRRVGAEVRARSLDGSRIPSEGERRGFKRRGRCRSTSCSDLARLLGIAGFARWRGRLSRSRCLLPCFNLVARAPASPALGARASSVALNPARLSLTSVLLGECISSSATAPRVRGSVRSLRGVTGTGRASSLKRRPASRLSVYREGGGRRMAPQGSSAARSCSSLELGEAPAGSRPATTHRSSGARDRVAVRSVLATPSRSASSVQRLPPRTIADSLVARLVESRTGARSSLESPLDSTTASAGLHDRRGQREARRVESSGSATLDAARARARSGGVGGATATAIWPIDPRIRRGDGRGLKVVDEGKCSVRCSRAHRYDAWGDVRSGWPGPAAATSQAGSSPTLARAVAEAFLAACRVGGLRGQRRADVPRLDSMPIGDARDRAFGQRGVRFADRRSDRSSKLGSSARAEGEAVELTGLASPRLPLDRCRPPCTDHAPPPAACRGSFACARRRARTTCLKGGAEEHLYSGDVAAGGVVGRSPVDDDLTCWKLAQAEAPRWPARRGRLQIHGRCRSPRASARRGRPLVSLVTGKTIEPLARFGEQARRASGSCSRIHEGPRPSWRGPTSPTAPCGSLMAGRELGPARLPLDGTLPPGTGGTSRSALASQEVVEVTRRGEW